MNEMIKRGVVAALASVGAFAAAWGIDVEMWMKAVTPELIVGMTTFVTVMVAAVWKKFMPTSWNPIKWFWA